MQIYELDAVVKENRRIRFYVFYNSHAGYHELWTPDIVVKNINRIKDLDDYHCIV